jgi:hypothetical protein
VSHRGAEIKAAKEELGAIFDRFLVGEPIIGDKDDFIKIGLKYLSQP